MEVKRETVVRFFVLALLAALSAGCTSATQVRPLPTPDPNYENYSQAAVLLDGIAQDLEEFGTVSVSAAAIIPQPGDFFGFRLDLTPRDIFERNRFEATSSSLDARAVGIQIAAAVDLLKRAKETSDPEEAEDLRDQAETQLAVAMVNVASGSDGEETPEDSDETGEVEGDDSDDSTGDDADDTDADESPAEETESEEESEIDGENARIEVDLPTHALAESVLHSQQFSAGQPRRTDPLELSLRQLIKLTFDDHTTLKLFEWLSQPSSFGLGPNKMLMAAVLNVNVRPGRLTGRGFAGEVDVQVGYGNRKTDDGVEPAAGFQHPLAFAVFPALDSQVLDLRSSVRRQLAISLALQALGPDFDSKAGFDFVRRLEQDASSVSFRNTVVGYNTGGRNFGWRFSPRFDAQGDPDDEKPKKASTLQADSFPALVLILADREDLSPEVAGPETPLERQQRNEECHRALLAELGKVRTALADLTSAGESLVAVGESLAAADSNASAQRISSLEDRLRNLEDALRNIQRQQAAPEAPLGIPSEAPQRIPPDGSQMAGPEAIYDASGEEGSELEPFDTEELPVESEELLGQTRDRFDSVIQSTGSLHLQGSLGGAAAGRDGVLACQRRAGADHLIFYQTMRWLPMEDRPRWGRSSLRLSEQRIFDWARSLDQADKILLDAEKKLASSKTSNWPSAILRDRFLMLSAAALGTRPYAALPTRRPAPAVIEEYFHGWQNRRTEIAILGEGFTNQVKAAVIGGRLCSTSVVSDESLVVSCDAWKAKQDIDRAHQIWLVTTRGIIPAGTIQFDRRADSGSGKLSPFVSVVGEEVLAGKPFVFSYIPDGLPSERGDFALFLRPRGQLTIPWTEIASKTNRDAAAKLFRVDFEKKTAQGAAISWLDEPFLLDVDLRLRANPEADPETTLLQPATVRYFPSESGRKLKLAATALSFTKGDDPKAESEIQLIFGPSIDRFREIFGVEVGSAADLIVQAAAGGEVTRLPVKVAATRLFVEKSEIDEKATELLKHKTKKVKLILSLGSSPTRIEVADDLTINQKT